MSDVLEMEEPVEVDLDIGEVDESGFPDIPTNKNQPVHGLYEHQIEEVSDEQTRTVLDSLREEVPMLAGEPENLLEAKRGALEEEGEYTDEGIEARVEEYRQQLAEKYLPERPRDDIPGRGLPGMRHRIKTVKRRLLTRIDQTPAVPEPESDGHRAAAREREIRETLSEVESTTSRMERARELVQSGDPEAIRAVIDPPAGTSPIPEDTREQLKRDAVRALHGAEAVQLREDLEAVERAETVVDQLERKLTRRLGADQ